MSEENKKNPMREIKIEKVVLTIGGLAEELEKGYKLLEIISGQKPAKTRARKRIPAFGIRPGLEIGAVVTVRGKEKEKLLNRLLAAIDNVLKEKQISENNFSFGIKEYIEIPGMEYSREIGSRGLDVTVVFRQTGRRIKLKKVRQGKVPKRQRIKKEEIIKFMEDKFKTKFIGKIKK